jgi:hypothetical protein
MLYEERSSESRCGIPMSEIDRDLPPSREEERLLKRALGSAIPEFIARFGADNAIKRAEAELRRARRARSRKLYVFWSAVLAQIDPAGMRVPSGVSGPRGALWVPAGGANPTKAQRGSSDDRLSPAPAGGAARPVITGQALETPAPHAPRKATSRRA